MTRLEEYLVEPFEPDETEHRPFTVDGIGTAEWVASKLRRARTQLAAIDAEYETWKRRADEWRANESKRWEHDVQWAEALLSRWMEEQRAETGRKSITLPSGTRIASTASTRTDIVDQDLLVTWLESIDRTDLCRLVPAKAYLRSAIEEAAAVIGALVGYSVAPAVPGAEVTHDVTYRVEIES